MNNSKESLVKSSEFFKALSNPERVKILELFLDSSKCMTLKELHSKITDKNPDMKIYRESLYKSLEKLVKSGILKKKQLKGKNTCYILTIKSATIDFRSLSLYYEKNNMEDENGKSNSIFE